MQLQEREKKTHTHRKQKCIKSPTTKIFYFIFWQNYFSDKFDKRQKKTRNKMELLHVLEDIIKVYSVQY